MKLLIPSKQWTSSYATVYFTSKYRNTNNSEVIIDKPNKPKPKNIIFHFFQIIIIIIVIKNFLRDSGFIHRLVDGGYYNLYIGNTTKVKKSNFLSK